MKNNWLRLKIASQFERFLKKRLPGKSTHHLNRLNLFILPSRSGGGFIMVIGVLFTLGTNYQNNIILLLSYVLLSLFLTSMLNCFSNLSGLTLSVTRQVKGYANQSITIPVDIYSPQERSNFSLLFPNQNEKYISGLKQGVNIINVPVIFSKRGHNLLGRLKISSQFSLGLFTCWTHVDFAKTVIIYPSPKKLEHPPLSASINESEKGSSTHIGIDELYQLSKYQQGEPLTQVSWKHLARGQGMLTKQYQRSGTKSTHIVLNEMPSSNVETQLQYCCYLLQQAMNNGQEITLDLGSAIIVSPENNNGTVGNVVHFENCLMALALYKRGILKDAS